MARARLLRTVRQFFQRRKVLEVETPSLYPYTNPEPVIDSFECITDNINPRTYYLQTSPEFAMKRLLANGSGAIFQICKAYRKSESGRWHNPEFTMLEWYQPGYTLQQLMEEIESLLIKVIPADRIQKNTEYLTYQSVFTDKVGIDPMQASISEFKDIAVQLGFPEAVSICQHQRNAWLDFLFSHQVQANLPRNCIVFVYHYPACQAALARLHPEHPQLAERVEVFIDGVELGNGYRELTDVVQQRQRFESQQQERRQLDMPVPELDEMFLGALQAGLPDCSGMAIGLDRVLMSMYNREHIDHVLAFPLSRQ
ncbi:MAG: EF-P lysine aminoacylase GenX [Gammaproteobacteria bacterium]|nr:EF-P lysine aminoacylase GenX [Gammaproteobacteria bacterium]